MSLYIMSASKFFPRSVGNFVTRNEFLNTIELLATDIENLEIDISGIISDLSFGEANKVVFRDGGNNLATEDLFGYDGETLTLGLETKTATFIQDLKLEVSGGVFLSGYVLIDGSLNVMGDMTTINTINLDISANKITLNKGLEDTGLPPSMILESGLIIERGTEPDYHIFYKEDCKSVHVGLSGEALYPLAEREEEITEGSILVWTRRAGYPTCNGYLKEVALNWDTNRLKIGNTLDMSCNLIIDVSNILFCNGLDLLNTIGTIDASINILEGRVDVVDISIGILDNRLDVVDVSIGILDNRLDVVDVSIGILDNRLDVVDVSIGILDNRLDVVDVSIGILDNRLDVVDVSIGILDNRLDVVDISIGILDNRLDVVDVSIGILDNRLDVTDISIADLYDIKYDKTGGFINGNVSISGELDMCCNNILDISNISYCGAISITSISGSDFGISIGEGIPQLTKVNNQVSIGNLAGFIGQSINGISIGRRAGQDNQKLNGIAIGTQAGQTEQHPNGIAIGLQAGQTNQNSDCIAIGDKAGQIDQSANAISIGKDAGRNNQKVSSIAIGRQAGQIDQSNNSIAIGSQAGQITQGEFSISIGRNAGRNSQATMGIAIGDEAGRENQRRNAISIGLLAGFQDQSANSIAIGRQAAQNTQATESISIGNEAGKNSQKESAIAIGRLAGFQDQSANSIAIGRQAAQNTQGTNSIAIGNEAGKNSQKESAIAIGRFAGFINQAKEAIAVGFDAGVDNQGEDAIAFGQEAGNTDQGERALAFGYRAGSNKQGTHAIALGDSAGRQRQCLYSLALGNNAGEQDQSCNTVAIGRDAGRIRQGTGSIAIGRNAGYRDQHPRSIVINGLDVSLNTGGSERLYIKPIRVKTNFDVSGILTYDMSGEITNNTAILNAFLDVCYNSVWKRDNSGNIYYDPEPLPIDRFRYGYVGIGTTNAQRPLHFVQYANGQTTIALQQFDTSVNQVNVISFRDGSFNETGAIDFRRPVPSDLSRNKIGFYTRSRELNGLLTENVSIDGITLEVRKIASFIENDAVDISDNAIIRGTLDMCCNIIQEVSGIYFCDGTYIGQGSSFDISANQVLVLSGIQDVSGNYNGASIVTKDRVYQQINPDSSWNAVNGYYGLAKDAYPALSKSYAEKAVSEWNLRNAVNNTLSWRRVKWIPELGQFLAVPNNSTTLQISNNGIDWTPVTAGFSYAYRQIAWSKELNRAVIGNTGNPAVNRLAYSDDLINWNYTDISDNRFESVVWASEIGLFVASSSLDNSLIVFNRILTSPDGINWTKRSSVDDSQPWRPLCWSAELGILVNLVNKASLTVISKLQISRDGINWTEYQLQVEGNWTDMVWSKELGLFVVVGDTFLGGAGNQPSKIITSSDGINWTEQTNPDTTVDWFGIEWSPELGLFVVVGSKTGGPTMITSSNGIDWNINTSFDIIKGWSSISWSPELGIFVACAFVGTGERLITSSLDGRPPTSYNVFDSSFNNIDSSGNWTIKTKEIYNSENIQITSNNGISQLINTDGDTLFLDGQLRTNLTERIEKIQIHSLSAGGSAAGFYCYDAGVNNSTRLEMYKNESGNINIDTAVGTASTLGFIGFQGMSATGYLRGATIQAVTENTNVATGLRFLTKGTTGTAATRMTINSDGNVGIGTTPTSRLDISGSINLNQAITYANDKVRIGAAITQDNNTVIINATGTGISTLGTNRTYITPVRDISNLTTYIAGYTTTSELVYDSRSTIDGLGRLSDILIFTANSNFVKDNVATGTLKSLKVTVVGGGGGGGGSAAAAVGRGAGGGGGGLAQGVFKYSELGISETITVGAGGSGGAVGSNGTAGGTTSFGALISATGGGLGAVAGAYANGPEGGLGSNGEINLRGGRGDGRNNDFGNINARGGNSPLGYGYGGASNSRGTGGIVGLAGIGYGGGGSGGAYITASGAGGAGSGGVCILELYTS